MRDVASHFPPTPGQPQGRAAMHLESTALARSLCKASVVKRRAIADDWPHGLVKALSDEGALIVYFPSVQFCGANVVVNFLDDLAVVVLLLAFERIVFGRVAIRRACDGGGQHRLHFLHKDVVVTSRQKIAEGVHCG